MSQYSKHEISAKAIIYGPTSEDVLLVKYHKYNRSIGVPGGHLNGNGEQPLEALEREVYEELGIELPENIHFRGMWLNEPDETKGFDSRLVLAYTGTRSSLELPNPPTDNEEGFWNRIDQLPESLDPQYQNIIIGSVALHQTPAVVNA